MEMTSLGVEELVREFSENILENDLERNEIERICFERILRGVVEHLAVIDAKLVTMLAKGWRTDRIDRTLLAILRAGLYEILFSASISPQIVIAEYRKIAESFFSSSQVRLVRAILERAFLETGPQ